MREESYQVLRMYRDSDRIDLIDSGLTLDQAQAHCKDPETSSSTCTTEEGCTRAAQHGPWFDAYEDE